METISSEGRLTGNGYIAFFDLDRTLIKAISGRALSRGAIRKGLMKRTTLIHALYLSLLYKLKFTDPERIINYMVSWVEGLPEKTLNDLCFEVYKNDLLPSVYDEARNEIKKHKEKNAKVVILSSALIPICREISNSLGIDDFICSDLEVIEGHLTGRPKGVLCFGKEKVTRMIAYCDIKKADLSEAWYYGDSISDLEALSSVGNPVCVNPDYNLRKAAHKRGWKILKWH
jgi:putative phosphoserine phosphatase / 1-acylglycerol-3-phosphate O-acyltransferase